MKRTQREIAVSMATAAVLLLGGVAMSGPAAAKDGADDGPTHASDDSSSRPTDGSSAQPSDDSSARSGGASATRAASPSGSTARRTKTGSCSISSDWKLKTKPRDGGLEVEFEVDSNRSRQKWTYTIRRDGNVVASGRRTTKAPSGSFSVERRLPGAPADAAITATATNARTGETCRAAV